jgi:outer membrane protein OmpA-like peptidoglycan-associated protein
MSDRLRTVVVIAVCGLLTACGPKRVQTQPQAPAAQRRGESLVVLLPDAGGGVGRATVSNAAGNIELREARAATRASGSQAPAAPTVMSEAEVEQTFNAALAALPPIPRHFTLYFQFRSDDLTEESRALVSEVLKEVKSRAVPDVIVVGHTDTTGTAPNNVRLGLKRANMMRDFLVKAGLDPSVIDVTSHGEADPLVPTADDVNEPRNRRVEITVR